MVSLMAEIRCCQIRSTTAVSCAEAMIEDDEWFTTRVGSEKWRSLLAGIGMRVVVGLPVSPPHYSSTSGVHLGKGSPTGVITTG